MSTLTQFMIIIMAGIMKVMHRLVKSWVRIRSVLAWSKRCSSCFSREKARNGAPFCPGSGGTGTSLRSAPCWSGPGLWALPVF